MTALVVDGELWTASGEALLGEAIALRRAIHAEPEIGLDCPKTTAKIKREIWNAQFQGLGEAIEAANADMAGSFVSEDFKEGVAHYLEKRAPAFTGR